MTPRQIEKRLGALQDLRDEANTIVANFSEACAELATEIREYMEGRSEAWLEGERGQAYDAFASALEDVEAEVAELPELDV